MPSGNATAASARLASCMGGISSHSFFTKQYLSAVSRHVLAVSAYSWGLGLPPNPPIAYIFWSGPNATESSSRFIIISGNLLHLPFLRSKQSNFLRTDPFCPLPLLPPQKKILASSRFTQAANPERAFGILNGRTLNLLCFKLYSSMSAVLCPSDCFPPKIKIRVFEIGTAANFVLALLIGAISRQSPL